METRRARSTRGARDAPDYDDPDATTHPARGRRLWSSRTLGAALVVLLLAIGAVTLAVWRATAGPPHLLTAREGAAAAWLGDATYVVGGLTSSGAVLSTAESLGGSSRSWSTVPSLPLAVQRPAVTAFGSELYVIGGFTSTDASSVTDAVQVYDRTTNAWRLADPLPVPLGGAAAVTAGGRIYVIGGTGAAGAVSESRAYSPSTGTWHELPPMPTARHSLAVGLLGGRIHAVGGFDDVALAVHEAYDLATGAWVSLEPIATARADAAAAVSGSCLVVAGGTAGQAGDSGSDLASVESYAPATDSWSYLADLSVPRRGSAATVTPRGDVLLIGGSASGFTVTRLTRPLCSAGG